MTGLFVPHIAPDADALTAGLDYAEGDFYVLPVRRGTKHPGSVVGTGWHHQSSREPEQIVAWFAGTNHCIALHIGRSGGVVPDVDNPERLPKVLADSIEHDQPPYQSTRADVPGRGHYLYAVPPGRRLGNSTGKLGKGWGEIRGTNGVIVVAPSVHELAASGGRYEWLRTGAVPVLPEQISALLPEGGVSEDAVSDAEVRAFREAHTANHTPGRLIPVLARYHRDVAAGQSRHDAMVSVTCWAAREAKAGAYPAGTAFTELRTAFTESLRTSRPGSDRIATEVMAHAEYGGIVAWAIAQAVAEPDPDPLAAPAVAPLIKQLRTWQHLPDTGHILVTLATAVVTVDDGEPVWLLLVAPPSSGKTETVRLLDTITDGHLDELSAPGLLSWRPQGKGRAAIPGGVLTRITRGLLTLGDLSTLLATSDHGGRDLVFAALRRVYDGRYDREVTHNGRCEGELAWEGRITIAGAVTGAIDGYSTHASELGTRWLYYRLDERDSAAKREASKLARRGDLVLNRERAADLAAGIVRAGRNAVPRCAVTDPMWDAFEDVALVCCWGRAAVPRHGYGRREIDGMAVIEEPPRVVKQLGALARGLLALGCTEQAATALCRRVALDSMPAARYAVLAALAGAESDLSTAAVGRDAGVDRGVARRTCEELEAVGVVVGQRVGREPLDESPDHRLCTWRLVDSADGELISSVIRSRLPAAS